MSIQHHRCPECGERNHLYGRADCRWDHDRQEWVVGDMENAIECTECDWSGGREDTAYDPDAVEDDEPCPVNRRPKSSCPDGCGHGEDPMPVECPSCHSPFCSGCKRGEG